MLLSAPRGSNVGTCFVTFDDGWHDTHSEAWPILKRYDMPAVVFLATRFIGSSETFWQERLGELMQLVYRAMKKDSHTYVLVDHAWLFASRALVVQYQGPPDLSAPFLNDVTREG